MSVQVKAKLFCDGHGVGDYSLRIPTGDCPFDAVTHMAMLAAGHRTVTSTLAVEGEVTIEIDGDVEGVPVGGTVTLSARTSLVWGSPVPPGGG